MFGWYISNTVQHGRVKKCFFGKTEHIRNDFKEGEMRYLYEYSGYFFLAAIIVAMLVFLNCAGQQVEAGKGYCKWDACPSYLVKDLMPIDWGIIDGQGFIEDGDQYWALLLDDPDTGLGCDLWVLLVEVGEDERYGPGTPVMYTVTSGFCEDWDELIEGFNEITNGV